MVGEEPTLGESEAVADFRPTATEGEGNGEKKLMIRIFKAQQVLEARSLPLPSLSSTCRLWPKEATRSNPSLACQLGSTFWKNSPASTRIPVAQSQSWVKVLPCECLRLPSSR